MSAGSRFKSDFRKMIRRAGDKVDDFVVASAFQLLNSLILKSPVGNPDLWASPAPPGYTGGTFRANWNVSFGAPDLSTTEKTDEGEARNTGLNRLQAYQPGSTIFITNGMPYAQRLEYGWSTQAPNGMVRITIVEFASEIRRIARRR